jgi:hypothetical protein
MSRSPYLLRKIRIDKEDEEEETNKSLEVQRKPTSFNCKKGPISVDS